MVRGINKLAIFKADEDKSKFLERLGNNVCDGKASVYAWVLMNNHAHILLKSGREGISSVMGKLLTWYAQYYNRRHQRSGHLFENRYKSILCDEARYLLALIRYIHLNPLRAKIVATVEELNRYPWSGHSAVMGEGVRPWMDADHVLLQFGSQRKVAMEAYKEFIEDGVSLGHNAEFTGGGLVRSQGGWSQVMAMRRKKECEGYDERILGGGDFVGEILKEADERQRRQVKIRNNTGMTIQKVMNEECDRNNINVQELKSGSRRKKVSEARSMISLRCYEELGLSSAEIARHVGVNTSSILRAIDRRKKTGQHS